jgi:hypothetical protein
LLTCGEYPRPLEWEDEMQEYELIMTEDDRAALLNIINLTTFKGSDASYVTDLLNRVTNAPLRQPEAPPIPEGDKK